MASIQVVEIRPLEYEIEDLSENLISSIWGGDRLSAIARCLSTYYGALDNAESVGDVLRAQRGLIDCLNPLFI